MTPVILDVTDAQQLTLAVTTIAGHVGDAGLAGLVNNAGIGVFGPLETDARAVLDAATPEGRDLYESAFLHLVGFPAGIHKKGSSPDVVALTVEHALRATRPRSSYRSGKNARRMATVARLLPVPVQDGIRRKLARQPAPGTLAGR